jgi:hypothetical protein
MTQHFDALDRLGILWCASMIALGLLCIGGTAIRRALPRRREVRARAHAAQITRAQILDELRIEQTRTDGL